MARPNRRTEELNQVNERLTEIATERTSVIARIAELDALTISDPGVAAVINQKKKRLQRQRDGMANRLARLNAQKTLLQGGFDAGQQTKVDTINTTFSDAYADKLSRLETKDEATKTEFFRLYDACDNPTVAQAFLDAYAL